MDSRSWREGRGGRYAATGGLFPPRSARPAAMFAPGRGRRSPAVRSGLALLTGAALLVPSVSASAPVSFADSTANRGVLGAPGWERTDADRGDRSDTRPDAQGGPDGAPGSDVRPTDASGATEPFDALPDLATVQVDFTPPSQAAVLASGFVLPVHGVPTSPFGLRLHPIQHVWKLHSGQDLAAACGTPVVAVKDATVTFVGRLGGYGGRVVLDHGGGLETTYNHLSAYAAVPGLVVRQGQVIGFVGTTGMSTGCHLHFEVKINGAFVDPAPYLGMAPAPKVVIPPAVTPTPVGPSTPTSTGRATTSAPPSSPAPTMSGTTTSGTTTTAGPPSPTSSATSSCPTTVTTATASAGPGATPCPTTASPPTGTATTSPTTSATPSRATTSGPPTSRSATGTVSSAAAGAASSGSSTVPATRAGTATSRAAAVASSTTVAGTPSP